MTPVYQTPGRCFAACVASFLDLPLSEMPAITVWGPDSLPRWNAFLNEHGYALWIAAPWAFWNHQFADCFLRGGYFYVISAKFPDADQGCWHTVLCQGEQIVHDPEQWHRPISPNEINWLGLFIPLERRTKIHRAYSDRPWAAINKSAVAAPAECREA